VTAKTGRQTTTTVSVGSFTASSVLAALVTSAATSLTVVANLAALSWFGMWMGLNSRNVNLATLKTFLFVQIIPGFVVAFASALIAPLLLFPRLRTAGPSGTSQMMAWYPLIVLGFSTLLSLAKDTGFLLWHGGSCTPDFANGQSGSMADSAGASAPALN